MDLMLSGVGGVDLGWEDPTHNATWPFDIVVTWQMKNVISPLSQGLWTQNLAGWWLPRTKSRDKSITSSRDKLSETLNLPIHKAHGP